MSREGEKSKNHMNRKPLPQGDRLELSVTLLGAVIAEAMESHDSFPLNQAGLMEPKNTNVLSCLQLIFVTSSSLHILRESPVELKPDAARDEEGSLGVGGFITHLPPGSMVTEDRSHWLTHATVQPSQPELESLFYQTGLG